MVPDDARRVRSLRQRSQTDLHSGWALGRYEVDPRESRFAAVTSCSMFDERRFPKYEGDRPIRTMTVDGVVLSGIPECADLFL